MNVWFLRMDKDDWNELNLSKSYQYIHSAHGSCGDLDKALKYKSRIFPELTLSGRELAKVVREIKEELVTEGKIDIEKSGKRRCDIAIRYWLSVMQIGDLVFVRTKQGQILLCRIKGYITEEFFLERGCFQRPVEILGEITEHMVASEIWRRTQGRKTIERNAKKHISDWVTSNYRSLFTVK